eukprot:4707966-Amphidinium_carterae.1
MLPVAKPCINFVAPSGGHPKSCIIPVFQPVDSSEPNVGHKRALVSLGHSATRFSIAMHGHKMLATT